MSANPLHLIRTARGISLSSLATALDCNKGHLSRIERGEAQCSPDLANRLAKYFDGEITRDQILFPADYIPTTKKPVRSARAQEASATSAGN